MIDVWVCSRCSSINRQRSERCYSCGAQRDVGVMARVESRSRARDREILAAAGAQ